MNSEHSITNAIDIGRRLAEETIAFRDGELQRRTAAITEGEERPLRATAGVIDTDKINRLGPESRDVLIAEGDSWFDYPFNDVLRFLEDHHGYDVESVAHKGDRLEEMAYAGGQLEEFTRLVEKVLRRRQIPRAILLSGGGNDVAGDEFGMLLNHAQSSIAGLNESIIYGVINERVKMAYITIISQITAVTQRRVGRLLPILVHGYDYPVPDGRGFIGGWGPLPGPWLEPGFRDKGFSELDRRIELSKDLIERFNMMLEEIVSLPDFGHVKYVNLRETLSTDENYKDDWANELHPTADGFEKVTNKFVDVINALN